MLNSGNKISRLARQKKNILTLVLSEKNILNETKNHNPPFKLNGRSLISLFLLFTCFIKGKTNTNCICISVKN